MLIALRRTLQAWGTSGADLAAFDAWALWAGAVTGSRRERVDAQPVGSQEAAQELLCAVCARVLSETAGAPTDVRDALWLQARAGERLVLALLDAAARRGRRR